MKQARTGYSKKDFSEVSTAIENFISNYIAESHSSGLVIGLSGGLDSAVALQLCVRAAGAKKILGIILPTESTPAVDLADAAAHAASLSIRSKTIDISPVLDSYAKILPDSTDKIKGNLAARLRMSILYYQAALENYLVVGTSDKSELYVGYFTKYGDGGSDLMPLAGLYKTQVRELGKYLGIPGQIIEKKSSPRLWPDQVAEEELGIDYETIDSVLYCLIDKAMKPQQAAKKLQIPLAKVKRVESMVKASEHKRRMPPVPSMSDDI